FLAAHAVARRAEQIDRVEPANQRRPRVLEDGPGGRVHMVSAMGANVGAALRQLVVRRVLGTDGAFEAGATEANLHDVIEAGVFGREALEELANRELRAGRGAFVRHAQYMARLGYMRQ